MALHTDEPKMPTDHPISSPSVPDDDNSDDAPSEKVPSSAREDEYPQGLMLYSLVAANIISVFLIALDQVSTRSLRLVILHAKSDQIMIDYRRYGYSKDHG